LAALIPLILVAEASADDPNPETTARKLMTPETDLAIGDGLRFLASRQNDDGSFGTSRLRGNVAVCSLAGLAFMAGGSTPGRGPYGREVDACVDYVLDQVDRNGLFVDWTSVVRGPMYEHGFATLFLAECHGMSQRTDLRQKLVEAVRLIVGSQNDEGGWRYYPVRHDADLSVTVCQVMALRAARNAGLGVPRRTIDRAVDYVKQCQNPDGGFTYRLEPRKESGFARSAAGLVALYSAGVYEGGEVDAAIRYVRRFTPKPEGEPPEYYYYGHYYAVQAMWHAGGDPWQSWYPAVRDELIHDQLTDGSWQSDRSIEYATAVACFILQVPNNCLPIIQR
jgi:hypothetical protein